MVTRSSVNRRPHGGARRNRAAAWAPVLAVALMLAAGNDSVVGEERDDSVAAAGQLDLLVSHQMERGRLIVRLAGTAFLSLPLMAAGGGAIARFERPLSVPIGRHPVEISFVDAQGRVVARKRTEGTVVAGRSSVLRIDERSGSGDGLTLTWRTP